MPNGNLEILREYTCGCIVYLDENRQEFTEAGLFCEPTIHAIRLTRGQETQESLF